MERGLKGGRLVTCSPRGTLGSNQTLAGFADGFTLGIDQGLSMHIAQQLSPGFILLEGGAGDPYMLNEDGTTKIKIQDRNLF